MTPQDTLLSLAARVEAATGPDRELDRLIEETLPGVAEHPDTKRFAGEVGREPYVISTEGHPDYEPGQGYIPARYTASLDHAMTLAEPFMLVALSDIAADGLTGCCLCSDTASNPPTEHWGVPSATGPRQQVLARAVVAASLKARAGAK